jgi:hypothetical protein
VFAVLAAIVEDSVPVPAREERFPEQAVLLLRCLAGGEQAGGVAEHFGGGVAGDLGETGVDVFDLPGCIGDHDGSGALLDGAGEQAQAEILGVAGGDVLTQAGDADGDAAVVGDRYMDPGDGADGAVAGGDGADGVEETGAGLDDALQDELGRLALVARDEQLAEVLATISARLRPARASRAGCSRRSRRRACR